MSIRIHATLMAMSLSALLVSGPAFSENIDPDNDGSQFAYGENVGWLNAEPSGEGGPGVHVDGSTLKGYIWGENIGWVNLSCLNKNSCATVNFGVVKDASGALSGYAWAENVGWINFAPTGGGVSIDPSTGEFNGRAWGENIGWVSFNSTGPVAYKVKTASSVQACIAGDLDCDGDVDQNDLNILLSYRNQPASSCALCDLNGDGTITGLDARKLTLLCTNLRCAVQ